MTPCSLGATPVVIVACTGQVTQGKLGTSGTDVPFFASDASRGSEARSLARSPGTGRRTAFWCMGGVMSGVRFRERGKPMSCRRLVAPGSRFDSPQSRERLLRHQWLQEFIRPPQCIRCAVAVPAEFDVDAPSVLDPLERGNH